MPNKLQTKNQTPLFKIPSRSPNIVPSTVVSVAAQKHPTMMVSEMGMTFVDEERRKVQVIEEAKEFMRSNRTNTLRHDDGHNIGSPIQPSARKFMEQATLQRLGQLKLTSTKEGGSHVLQQPRTLNSSIAEEPVKPSRKSSTSLLRDSALKQNSGLFSPSKLNFRDSNNMSLGAMSNFNFLSLVAITKKVRSLRSPRKSIYRVMSNPVVAMDSMSILKESLKFQDTNNSESQYVKNRLGELSDHLKEYERQEKLKKQLQSIAKKNEEISITDAIKHMELEGQIGHDNEKEGCVRDIRVVQDLRKIENMNKNHNERFRKRKERAYIQYEKRLEEESEAHDVVAGVARLQEEFNQMFEHTSRLQSKKMPTVVGRAGIQIISTTKPSYLSLADNNTGHVRTKSLQQLSTAGKTESSRISVGYLGTQNEHSSLLSKRSVPNVNVKVLCNIPTEKSSPLLWSRKPQFVGQKHSGSLPELRKAK